MILINVFFAETNRAYDFRVDTDTPLSQVVADIVSLIALREHLLLDREPGVFLLCRKTTGEIFGPGETLSSYNVHTGDDLILL